MKRTDALDATPGGLFTDGDPAVPTPASVLDASWLNMVQEELVGVILMAGLTLDPLDDTQLYAALEILIMGAIAAHLVAGDPHPQYATDDDLQGHVDDPNPHPQYQAYADIAVADHEAASDPHPQYLSASASAAEIFFAGAGF